MIRFVAPSGSGAPIRDAMAGVTLMSQSITQSAARLHDRLAGGCSGRGGPV